MCLAGCSLSLCDAVAGAEVGNVWRTTSGHGTARPVASPPSNVTVRCYGSGRLNHRQAACTDATSFNGVLVSTMWLSGLLSQLECCGLGYPAEDGR